MSYKTASGNHCCNRYLVAIIVATDTSYKTASGNHCCNPICFKQCNLNVWCYKTASGNHCCNPLEEQPTPLMGYIKVTKPQAVITVATLYHHSKQMDQPRCYKTASGNHCCNLVYQVKHSLKFLQCYKTASGNHCCNSKFFRGCI